MATYNYLIEIDYEDGSSKEIKFSTTRPIHSNERNDADCFCDGVVEGKEIWFDEDDLPAYYGEHAPECYGDDDVVAGKTIHYLGQEADKTYGYMLQGNDSLGSVYQLVRGTDEKAAIAVAEKTHEGEALTWTATPVTRAQFNEYNH